MTTNDRPAAVARALTGAGTAIAMIGMITGFQLSAAAAEQQAQVEAAPASSTVERGQAVRVLDPSLLPEIAVAAPIAAAPVSPAATGSRSSSAAAAPAAPAPAPAQPAPPANGTTAGSGG